MRIVVAGTQQQEEEWMTPGRETPAGISWYRDLADYSGPADACIDLSFDGSESRIRVLQSLHIPLVIINSVIRPLDRSTNGFVRMNGWNSFLKRPVVEAAAAPGLKDQAAAVFQLFGKKAEWVEDIPGFITPRIVASVINEAYFALEEGVSTKDEIDIAMKLGTNYPFGPFEWCRIIGTKNIASLLSALAARQARYQPAPLLLKEANADGAHS